MRFASGVAPAFAVVRGAIPVSYTHLTLPLVILTLGLFYLLINIGMVAFAAWVTPNFTVHGFWSYVGTVFIVWLLNWAVGDLVGRAEQQLATT